MVWKSVTTEVGGRGAWDVVRVGVKDLESSKGAEEEVVHVLGSSPVPEVWKSGIRAVGG